MPRMYNVIFEVTNQSFANFGKKIKQNATPMTHREACTFKSKMPNHDHGAFMLVEIKAKFIFATGHPEPLKASAKDRRYRAIYHA